MMVVIADTASNPFVLKMKPEQRKVDNWKILTLINSSIPSIINIYEL